MERYRIVIIDDEFLIGKLVERLIHWDDLNLQLLGIYDDSEEALKEILSEKPELIISDIRMPVIDGLELVKKVKEAGLESEIILISGFREFEYARTALKYGVKEYILKPVKEKEINEALENAIKNFREKEDAQQMLEKVRHTNKKLIGKEIFQLLQQGRPMTAIASEYSVKYIKGLFQAFILKVDIGSPDCEDIFFLLDKIENIVRESLGETETVIFAVKEHRSLKVLINYRAVDQDIIHNKLEMIFKRCNESISALSDVSVTMGIGEKVYSDHCLKTIHQAERLIRQRIKAGTGRVIDIRTLGDKRMVSGMEILVKYNEVLNNAKDSQNMLKIKLAVTGIFSELDKRSEIDPAVYYECAFAIIDFFRKDVKFAELIDKRADLRVQIEDCCTKEMLVRYLIQFLEEILEEYQATYRDSVSYCVREAIKYIQENYAGKVSLEDFAQSIEMNPTYISALFKKEMNKNFMTYVKEYRIEKAKELLVKTNDTMAVIAENVGYTDQRYFSQQFMKIVGIKPSIYRRLYS